MTDQKIRLVYTGKNQGAIPWRAPSGNVYRAGAKTKRFVDALPEDVDFLLRTNKFARVKTAPAPQAVKAAPVAAAPEPEPETVPESGEQQPNPIDLSTVASVRYSLPDASFQNLLDCLDAEQEGKARVTVLDMLRDAIDNHPDHPGSI